MSKLIKSDTALRYQLEDNNKGKYSEIPYEFITCISVSGTNIVIDSDIDPNPQNIIIPYASITAPTSANITQLKEILWCWVLSKSRKSNDENGDPYILITPEVEPCFGVIAHNSCPYVLQNVGGILYWDGSPIAGAPGSGILSVDNGLTENPVGNARLGGTLIQDTYTDAAGFEYFMNNFSIWRVQLGAADPSAAISLDVTRVRIANSTAVEIGTPRVIAGTASINQIAYLKNAGTGETEFRHPFNRMTAIDTTAGPFAVSLVSINALDGETRVFKIAAGANTLSINDSNGKLVEGVATYVFSTAGASRTFAWSTTNDQWYLISSYL